jgi:ketosteroid isomerase-like protein
MLLPQDVQDWMTRFARCVRERDYVGGEALFSPAVDAFGTVADRARGLDSLVERQWREVWDATEGFDFDYATAQAWTGANLTCVAARWSSRGLAGTIMPADRTGRATLLLTRDARGWQAVHTHFSIDPVAAAHDVEP